MIRPIAIGVASALLTVAAASYAKQYVDYTPEKGMWEITAVEVDPNHVDDYLTGLRQSQVTGFEVLKKRGVIDDYRFRVRTGYVKGSPNVLIEIHYPTPAVLEPNQVRDMAIEKDTIAKFSEDQQKKAVSGYEKYRTFVDDALWSEVTFAK